MNKNLVSRQRLESMSTADLISLADDYGIDIPDNLDRRFIIGELLEFTEAEDDDDQENDPALVEETILEEQDLPETYNDTTISVFLRSPAWLFVYWDIKESDIRYLKQLEDFEQLILHISFFENETDEKPSDSFDLKIQMDQRELSVLLPGQKKIVMATLAYTVSGEAPHLLCFSKKIHIPHERKEISEMQPGKKIRMSPLVDLSGMKEMLHSHYLTHRQSFIE
ncbi:MAG: DUF4912 domain-containing protein [Treponema sp.]|nr:DUF4912 domain-containing protein [Treponema sp.]